MAGGATSNLRKVQPQESGLALSFFNRVDHGYWRAGYDYDYTDVPFHLFLTRDSISNVGEIQGA
jgi:hypothetical protein